MPKISNTTQYPKLTSDTISTNDFVIGTRNSDNATRNFPLGAILATTLSAKIIDNITLDDATTYQSDTLIGATGVWAFFDGQHMNTANLIDSFDSETGTIAFNTDYTPFNGEINILYF